MPVKITYFVHGTTTDNEKNLSTGWNHGELSKLGIEQSEELKKQIAGKKFDVIFSSDLKRAVDSARITFGDKFIQDERLRECNYGDMNGADSESVEAYDCINKKFPNGESYKDVELRIKSFLKDLLKSYDNKRVAIVAHKAPQLALDVLLKHKTWGKAIKEDWRKTKSWQPGWEYEL
jgi:broad specificity phosphatase PhoE